MEAYAGELATASVNAYKVALEAMAKAGALAMPDPGPSLQGLTVVGESLSSGVTPAAMADVQDAVEQELMQWGERAAQYSRDKAKEIREIMVAMAAAATAIGERDQRYATRFSGLNDRLNSIARLEDLSSIRRSVVESANELKTVVAKMAEEGDRSISQLRAEVANYRARLEQSEKREAVDPLTGLANRREIEAQIEDRIAWQRGFCLAILDLNGFKRINDIHGHVAGDDLLKQFATELRAHLRASDLVGRWGGDEFVIVVDSGLDEAQVCLERVREWTFGEYKISKGKETVEVAVRASIGLAAWDGQESAVELLARADKCMYVEKKLTTMPRRGVA